MGVAEDPLHVGERHAGVAGHSVGRGVPQIVQRPVGPQGGVRRAEHPVGGVIAEFPEGAPKRPPQRIIDPRGRQAVHLCLVEPQPDEGVRRGRQLLDRPRAFADHGDQLLAGVGVAVTPAQQFRSPRAGGHPEGHQGAVPVRAELSEQLVELLVRDTARHPLDMPGAIET